MSNLVATVSKQLGIAPVLVRMNPETEKVEFAVHNNEDIDVRQLNLKSQSAPDIAKALCTSSANEKKQPLFMIDIKDSLSRANIGGLLQKVKNCAKQLQGKGIYSFIESFPVIFIDRKPEDGLRVKITMGKKHSQLDIKKIGLQYSVLDQIHDSSGHSLFSPFWNGMNRSFNPLKLFSVDSKVTTEPDQYMDFWQAMDSLIQSEIEAA